MTDLQIGLIGVGIAVVVGIVVYNKWQVHRAKKHVEQAFSEPVDDVLMNADPASSNTVRREPSLQTQDNVAGKADEAATGAQTAVQAEKPEAEKPEETVVIPPDELIELSITLNLDGNVRAEDILPQLQSLTEIGGKPVRYVGQTEADEASWCAVVAGKTYRRLKACVLLANRQGALTDLQYSQLISRLRQVADAIGAEPDVPEMADITEKARQLHQFIADHDAKLGISVRGNSASWQIATLKTVFAGHGFVEGSDGLFSMKDGETGTTLFTLSTNEPAEAEVATRLTLLMDVPCVPHELNGFSRMIECAKALCISLDGALIDDGNQLLTDTFLAEISGQVEDFYKEMQASVIPAGSQRALRLFN